MDRIDADRREWIETPFAGAQRCWLWRNASQGGSSLIRLAAGAVLPQHRHPGWEQVFVVGGRVRIGAATLGAGDYAFTHAGEVHDVEALEASELLVSSEKGVEYF